MSNLDEYWTTEQVADHYRVSKRTVEKWRLRTREDKQVGPRFVHVGRLPRYPLKAIEEYDALLEQSSA